MNARDETRAVVKTMDVIRYASVLGLIALAIPLAEGAGTEVNQSRDEVRECVERFLESAPADAPPEVKVLNAEAACDPDTSWGELIVITIITILLALGAAFGG